jgi:hypothetical protein
MSEWLTSPRAKAAGIESSACRLQVDPGCPAYIRIRPGVVMRSLPDR